MTDRFINITNGLSGAIYDLIIDEAYEADVHGVPIKLLIVDLTKEHELVDVDDGLGEEE
jgi:hypothetical protein